MPSSGATATTAGDDVCGETLAAAHQLFAPNFGAALDVPDDARALRLATLLDSEYATRDADEAAAAAAAGQDEEAATGDAMETDGEGEAGASEAFERAMGGAVKRARGGESGGGGATSTALVLSGSGSGTQAKRARLGGDARTKNSNLALALYQKLEAEKPEWHAPWKLMRVVSGHTGWVKSIAVDHSNEWFATGSADRTIKVWDLASGQLKISLTGHISTIRGLAISARSPYLFSVAEDKMVKCWDLETNKVTRHYHGHLSGIYCCTVHPTLDVLITGGRDATARVWDIRTKACVHVLGGHRDTIWDIAAQAAEPQIITGSADKVVRTWDLAAGKTLSQLTHHKKQIRSIALHPTEYSFATAGADNIKKWKCPEARFMLNFSGHNSIINTLQCNGPVMFSGGDNGSMRFWDWRTGYCFQREETRVQPGSLDAEAGIFASTFDKTGSRLITCEADKTIKFWKEDPDATEETHPIDPLWRKQIKQAKRI